MSAHIVFWQHLSPAIPHFGQQDPRLRDGKLTPSPNFPKTPSLQQRIADGALKPAVGSDKVGILVQALPCLRGFFAWSIKMFQREQDLQVLTDSDSNAICTSLFSFVFLAPQTQWTCLADCILQSKCPLASVLASEESWRELGAEQVPTICKPYHYVPHCFCIDQTAATLLDTQLNTRGGSLTCNYTQPRIHTRTHSQKTTALAALQHVLKVPLPEGPIYVFMLNTCYLLHMYYIVWVVHANQAKKSNYTVASG